MSRATGSGGIVRSFPTLTPADSAPDPWIFTEHLTNIVSAFLNPNDPVLLTFSGHGSLFKTWQQGYRYSLEDNEAIQKRSEVGSDNITNDVTETLDLYSQVGPEFGQIIVNDLRLEDDQEKRELLYKNLWQCFGDSGKFVFITDRDPHNFVDTPWHSGIFAVITSKLFTQQYRTVSVIFGASPQIRMKLGEGNIQGFDTKDNVPVDMIDLLPQWLASCLLKYYGNDSRYLGHYGRSTYRIAERFEAVRKRIKALKKGKLEFTLRLYGKENIQVHLSEWDRLVLVQKNLYSEIHHLRDRTLNYLVSNLRFWKQALGLEEAGCITIQPRLKEKMEILVLERERTICPINEITPAQRLGWLTDEDHIECILQDAERGFIRGHKYKIDCDQVKKERYEDRVEFIERGKDAGTHQKRRYRISYMCLEITIKNEWGNPQIFTDGEEATTDIAYLIKHFLIKDPGNVKVTFPDEYAYWFSKLKEVEAEFVIPCSALWFEKNPMDPAAKIRNFQLDQMARVLVKGSGLIAWDPGTGKTLAGPTLLKTLLAAGKCNNQALFVIPQDLHESWAESCERFFGFRPQIISKPWEAKLVAKHLKGGGSGIYITDYDKIAHRKKERDEDYVVWVEHKKVWNKEKRVYEDKEKAHTTLTCCPQCRSGRKEGYNGDICSHKDRKTGRVCGYRHLKFKTPTLASILATAFRKGVVILDEATQIQGRASQRSEAIRGIRAEYRFTLTGTPIKNYVVQAFWPMWWTCGNDSPRFPFKYSQRSKFERDHQVYEEVWYGKNWGNGKPVAEISNLSTLWRYVCSFTSRQRKQDTGEKLVPLKMHVQEVPLGMKQSYQYASWMNNFPAYFAELYPNSPLVKSGAHIPMAPMLGLGWKLEYAATCPKEDPAAGWTQIEGVSNFTPNNFQTLVLAMSLVKQGKKVLIGSNFKDYGPWIAAELRKKGIRAEHLVGPNGDTATPAKRAKIVKEFRRGKTQVLCAGTAALRLGHNLDTASACILNGLPWDYETYYQFRERVHRFTSQKPVDIYVVLPQSKNDTITVRKWKLINGKQDSASLALDGTLFQPNQEKMTKEKALQQLARDGFRTAGDELMENQISKWLSVPPIDRFKIPEKILGKQSKLGGLAGSPVLRADP